MSCNLIAQYNSLLPNLKNILRKRSPILYSDREMLNIFPENSINITYKRNKNLRELLSPSCFPGVIKEHQSSLQKCNKRCDICTNFLVHSNEFTCFATKRKYKVKGNVPLIILFIYYLVKIVVNSMLVLPLSLRKDLEYTKVI